MQIFDLNTNDRAVITAIQNPALASLLASKGIRIGEQFVLKRKSWIGKTYYLTFDYFAVALRKVDAVGIQIERL